MYNSKDLKAKAVILNSIREHNRSMLKKFFIDPLESRGFEIDSAMGSVMVLKNGKDKTELKSIKAIKTIAYNYCIDLCPHPNRFDAIWSVLGMYKTGKGFDYRDGVKNYY